MTTSVEDETASATATRRAALDSRLAAARLRRPLRQRLRLPLMVAGPAVVLLAAGYWYLTSGRYVSTDDAYVQAARMAISTDVAGRVVEIAVRDNEQVKAGRVLFRLDPRPFRIAVEQAKAQLAAERLQIDAMKATYHQKQADAKAAEHTVAYQQREFERQKQLIASGTTSRQQFEQASQAYDTGRQQLVGKQQDAANALANLGGDPVITLELNDPDAWTVDALDLEWDVGRPTEVLAAQALFDDSDEDGASVDQTDSGLDLLDDRGLSDFAGKTMSVLLTAPVDAADELTLRAQSVLREAGWFVRCSGQADVSRLKAVFRVGTVVQINGAGSLNSGKYFVWSVRHTIGKDSHKMNFMLVRNAIGSLPSSGGGLLGGLL